MQTVLSFSRLVRRASFHASIALVLGLPAAAYAAPCSVTAPMVANAKTDVVYDPVDSSMKACVAGTWITLSGGGGGGGNLDDLTDVVITTPSTSQALVYNGSAWVNATLSLTETDPKVGALTGSKWCAANVGGTAIVCNQDAPAAGATSSGAAGYVQISDGTGGFTTSGATAGEELFWNNASKRLGIGTAFPGQTLQLGTASVGQENYLSIGDANSQRLKIGYGHATGIVDNNFSAQIIADGTGNLVFSSRTSSASGLHFYTNSGTDGVERMRIAGSGNVGIGTTLPEASALLDVSSTAKGFLPPRMTTAEVTAVVTPADGLIVYDTDTDTIKLRANGAWVSLQVGGSSQWSNGASGTIYYGGGNVGVGTSMPKHLLDVNGVITTPGVIMNGYFDGTWRPKSAGYLGYIQTEASTGKMYFWNSPTSVAADGASTLNARMVIDKDGNVGIGTATPGYPFTVATGSGQYTTAINILPSTHSTSRRSSIALDDWLLLQDATGNGTKDFSIYQGSSAAHRLFISTAGNVGIGTAGPTSKLHVDGTGTLLQLTSSGFGSLYAGSDVNQPWFGTPASNDLRLVTNGAERMRIAAGGNVGIGTPSPAYKLSVYGGRIELDNLASSQSAIQFSSAGAEKSVLYRPASSVDLRVWGTGVAADIMTWDTTNGRVGIGTAGPVTQLTQASSGEAGVRYLGNGLTGASAGFFVGYNNQSYLWNHQNTPMLFATNNAERIRIDSSGNVGIGTTTPTRGILEVAGVVSATTAVFGTGNKGISLITNWPGVYWNSYYNSGVKAMSSGYSANFSQNPTTGAMTLGISAAAATAADEATAHATLMTILSNGNVGIGSGSPAGLLHVNSSDYASILLGNNDAGGFHITKEPGDDSFNVWSGAFGSGTNRFKIASSGNVGIGTTDPKSRLDISDSNGIGALTLGREGGFIGYNTYYNGGWKYKSNGYGGILRLDTTGMQFHGAPNNASGNDAAMTARLNMLIAPAGNVTVYGATTTCTLGNGSGATNCTSDGRLKDRIGPLTSALDKLSEINPVTFHWKDSTKDQREFLGLIAQEVEKVYPQAVDEVSDNTIGTAKTLDYAVMVVPVIAAIKELKAANDNLSLEGAQLRTENAQLRDTLDELKKRVDKLEYGK